MDKDRLRPNKTAVLLGVIPARSGSKGIKNKNLRMVLGKPLLSYSIQDALTYTKLHKTIVTTDSPEIARVARENGATVPFIRPKTLARDDTPMLAVLKHALLKCERLYGRKIDGIVLLDPTSPLREKAEIEDMIDLFLKKKPDLVVAVSKCRKNPYFNMLKIDKNGFGRLILKGDFVRRQDAPPLFDIANNCWIFSRRAVLNGWRIPKRTIPYVIKSFYTDIDKEDDLKFLEWHLRSKGQP
jgi:CMP-N-acetylneuraminic acid synthetase